MLVFAIPACGQFTIQTSNTTADLRGIHNVGNGVAWASGTNGTVLRTEDGGYVWQTCSIPPGAEKLDFRGVQAFDANTAIVMSSGPGDQSRLYKTTDGCHSWKLLFTNPDKDGFWDAIQFDRGKWGWLLGDPVKNIFVLLASEDGGRTWYRQRNKGLRASSTLQGAFAASNSSMIGSGGFISFASGGKGGAFLYATGASSICVDCNLEDSDHEGRQTKWERREVPIGSRTEASGVFSIARTNPGGADIRNESLVAVGGNYTRPDDAAATAAFSTDGGEHWQAATTPPHGYRSSVAYDSSTKTWITVGPNGSDISTDDGRNWHPIHPDPSLHEPEDADRNWNALSLPYVVGPKGRIGRLDPAALKPANP
jgi:photosystem II stability/assembly factor-like uncharacterized protein